MFTILMTEFYRAGSFLEHSPVSDFDFHVQIPSFRCEMCGQDIITNYYNYPHLDPVRLLSREELKRLGPIIRIKSSDQELLRITQLLRHSWKVPITAGTVFGPTRIKVTNRPKTDLFVLVGHAGLFCRRPAAERLKSQGLVMDWVSTPTHGKYSQEADYVEMVVPVMGHNHLPAGKSFCGKCLRYSPGGSFDRILLPHLLPEGQPFFKTLETGTIIFSGQFIDTVARLGITGFIEGETLLPIQVAS